MKVIKYLMLLFVAYIFAGCAKTEEVNNTETKVGQSRVTFFPILELKGAQYMVVPVGGTFTDPGATAKEGDKDIQPIVTGSVNTSTPGVYALTYTATNKDGFSTSEHRYVAVYTTDASAAANDLSGSYARITMDRLLCGLNLHQGCTPYLILEVLQALTLQCLFLTLPILILKYHLRLLAMVLL